MFIKFIKQVLLRPLNSYISKLKKFLYFRLVKILEILYPGSTEWVNPEESILSSEDVRFSKLIGKEPKLICSENVVINYPDETESEFFIILGLRLFNDLEGKTMSDAYKELLAAFLLNVKNHPDSDFKPFLFTYCFSNHFENLNREATFLYFDDKVYYVSKREHTDYMDIDDAFGLVMGEFVDPDHLISKSLVSEDRLVFTF